MTDWAAGKGDCALLDTPKRNYMLVQLSDILASSDVEPIWAGVNNPAWSLLTFEEEEFKKRYPIPYDLCFDEAVSQLWRWARHAVDGSPVSVIVAAQSKNNDKRSAEIYEAWRRHPRAGEFLGTLSFAFASEVIPLQAADMLAYEISHEWATVEFEKIGWHNNFGIRPLLDKITTNRSPHRGGLYGEQGLRTAIARFHAYAAKASTKEPP
jgi:hypothetical protein